MAGRGTASEGEPEPDLARAIAAAWLQDTQGHVYAALGRAPMTGAERDAALRETGIFAKVHAALGLHRRPGAPTSQGLRAVIDEAVDQSLAQILSGFEDSWWFTVVRNLSDRIEPALGRLGFALPVRPLFGTLPTGRMNGLAVALPDTPCRVIVIEDGLFGFANLMCKAFAMALTPESSPDGPPRLAIAPEAIAARIAGTPEIPKRFLDALGAYLVNGNAQDAEPYLPSAAVLRTAASIRQALEGFVLAHEYGHVVLGHLDGASGSVAMVGGASLAALPADWTQELEADHVGLLAMLLAQRDAGLDIDESFWGADAFFGCVEVVEHALGVLIHGAERPQVTDTHPPAAMRRDALRRVLARTTRGTPAEPAARRALEVAGAAQVATQLLWQMVRPAFLRMHADGVRPAASWLAATG